MRGGSKVVVLSLFMAPLISNACECQPTSVHDLVYGSDAVIVAVPHKVTSLPAKIKHFPSLLEVGFDVVSTIYSRPGKGDLKKITAVTADSVDACGVPIEQGREYILFLNLNDFISDKVTLTACDGSYQVDATDNAKLTAIKEELEK